MAEISSNGIAKDVVQHECEPLGGGQRLDDDQERQPNRVGQKGLIGGVGLAPGCEDGIRHPDERCLVPALACPEHVQTHAPSHRRQPRAHLFDFAGVGASEPQPGLLHRVLGFAEGAEHAVRDRAQVATVLLESFRQPVGLLHRPIAAQGLRKRSPPFRTPPSTRSAVGGRAGGRPFHH